MKNTNKLSLKGIIKLQKELNVVEEMVNYRISQKYFELFLQRYSEPEGKHGYIQGNILMSLFDFIKTREPNIGESEMINKSQRLYPIIRGMLVQEGAFNPINKVKRKSWKKSNKEEEV